MSLTKNYAELIELMDERRLSYSFFSNVFYGEVSEEFLEQLANFEADENTKLADFVASLKDGDIPTVARDLRCDYSAMFLNMSATPVYTSESVYLSPDHLLMREQRDQVVSLYRLNGLVVDESFGQPEDHIAIELLFMSHLCEKALTCAQEAMESDGDTADIDTRLEGFVAAQKGFFDAHLKLWVPMFCSAILKEADTLFYQGIAEYLDAFIKLEEEYFKGIK